MSLLYNAPLRYNSPQYTYNGSAVGAVLIALFGLIRDRAPLSGLLSDLGPLAGLVADRSALDGFVADLSAADGVIDDKGGMMGLT